MKKNLIIAEKDALIHDRIVIAFRNAILNGRDHVARERLHVARNNNRLRTFVGVKKEGRNDDR